MKKNSNGILSLGRATLPILTLALVSSGCSALGLGIVHTSNKSVISLEGSITGADGKDWTGRGQICFHVETLGMANKDGCADFDATKTPGTFVTEQDITEIVHSIPIYFNQKLWLNINGTIVPGTITTTGVEGKTLTMGNSSLNIAKVVVGASFRMPAGLPSQPVLVQSPADLSRGALNSLEGRPQISLGSTVSDQPEPKPVASFEKSKNTSEQAPTAVKI